MENKNFAIFIMAHGRPKKMRTHSTLRSYGYTGRIFLVVDNLDATLDEYVELYGKEVIVFDKNKAASTMDSGDNTGDLRSTLFAANKIFDLAKERGVEYFFIMCDDYYDFYYAFADSSGKVYPKNINIIFDLMIDYYKDIPAKSIAFSQTGVFIGGVDNGKKAYRFSKRKAMNTLLCSTNRVFEFTGRLNEDVTAYVNLGSRGSLFLTIPVIAMGQPDSQKRSGGLTDAYVDSGTYTKSFFTLMHNPSSVKVCMMNARHKRLHHRISWKNTTPMILSEDFKK
jgi:hypothetical protein